MELIPRSGRLVTWALFLELLYETRLYLTIDNDSEIHMDIENGTFRIASK